MNQACACRNTQAFPSEKCFKNAIVVDDKFVSRFLVPSRGCNSQRHKGRTLGGCGHKALKSTSRHVRVCACSQASGVCDWACRVPRWVHRICQHGSCDRRCVSLAADTSDAGDVFLWPNGQGVGHLIQRLRVREMQLSSWVADLEIESAIHKRAVFMSNKPFCRDHRADQQAHAD